MTDKQQSHGRDGVLPTAVEDYAAERLILDVNKWIGQEIARRRDHGEHNSADALALVASFINKRLQESQLASNAVGKIELVLQDVELSPGRWPWGTHETERLRTLAAAANQFWLRYDPDDPTTAPKNEQVIEWLVAEKKEAQRTAEVMATILRADGLPKGPRK